MLCSPGMPGTCPAQVGSLLPRLLGQEIVTQALERATSSTGVPITSRTPTDYVPGWPRTVVIDA